MLQTRVFHTKMLFILMCSLQRNFICQQFFNDYTKQYNKIYDTSLERKRARHHFCQQLLKISKLQSIVLNNNTTYDSIQNYINIFSDTKPFKNYGHIPINASLLTDQQEIIKNGLNAITDISQSNNKVEQLKSLSVSNLLTYNRENQTQIIQHCAEKPLKIATMDAYSNLAKTLIAKNLPKQVDLRKIGTFTNAIDQGTCGSCFAVASTYVLQSMLLKDKEKYKQMALIQNSSDYEIFASLTQNTKLSVEHLLNGTYGYNYKCAGGNSIYVMQQLAIGQYQSVEFDHNYKYLSKFDREDALIPELPQLQPLTLQNPLNPIHFMSYDSTGCPIAHIVVSGRQQSGFSEEGKQLIKSVLSQGIVVAVSMNTNGGSDQQNSAFNKYKTGIFQGECRYTYSNHQVAYIGYGTYKQTPVWIIANTWGKNWGVRGTFMVEQGSNALCTEMQAVISLHRFYGFEDQTYSSVDNKLKQSPLIHQNQYNAFVREGITGLDHENGTFKQVPYNWLLPLILITMIATILTSIISTCIQLFKNSKQLPAQWLKDSITIINSMRFSTSASSQLVQSSRVLQIPQKSNMYQFILKTKDPNIILIKIRSKQNNVKVTSFEKGYTDVH